MERHQKILEKAKDNILKAQLQQKKIYDRKHNVPEVFKIGNVVLKKDFTRKKRKGGKLDANGLVHIVLLEHWDEGCIVFKVSCMMLISFQELMVVISNSIM